jgi:hypothetical protein
MSTLPFIAQLVFKAFFATIAACLKSKKYSDTCVTKAFNLLG